MTDHQLTEAVELLKSRDAKKRMTAVDMAAELNTAGSVALLIKAIQDQSWSLREYAIKKTALAGHLAVQPLIRLLRDGVWYTRAAAAQALGLIGDVRALPSLVFLSQDTNRSVMESASKAFLTISRSSDIQNIIAQSRLMDTTQRKIYFEALSKTDKNLAEKVISLWHQNSGSTGSAPSKSSDDVGVNERLQELRREIKTILKQGDRNDNEDA